MTNKKNYKLRVDYVRKELANLIKACPHLFRTLTSGELTNPFMSVHADCEICSEQFGWRCVKSPDSVCHYFTTEDRDKVKCVELIDNTLDHNFPRVSGSGLKWNVTYETEDECLYCGQVGLPRI